MVQPRNIVRAAVYTGPRYGESAYQPYVRLSDLLILVAIDQRPVDMPITAPPVDRKLLVYTSALINETIWMGTEHRCKKYREVGYPHRRVICTDHDVICTLAHGHFNCCKCQGTPEHYKLEFLDSRWLNDPNLDQVSQKLLNGYDGRPSRLVVDANPAAAGVSDIPTIEALDQAFLTGKVGSFVPPQIFITDEEAIDYNEPYLERKGLNVARGIDILACQKHPANMVSYRCMTPAEEEACTPEEVASIEFTLANGEVVSQALLPGFNRICSLKGVARNHRGTWQEAKPVWRHIPNWEAFKRQYPASAEAILEELRSSFVVDGVLDNQLATDVRYCRSLSTTAVAWVKSETQVQRIHSKYLAGTSVPYTREENFDKWDMKEGRIGWDFRSMPAHWMPRYGHTFRRRDEPQPVVAPPAPELKPEPQTAEDELFDAMFGAETGIATVTVPGQLALPNFLEEVLVPTIGQNVSDEADMPEMSGPRGVAAATHDME